MPTIDVPVLRMTALETKFGLADITDLGAFRDLGRRIAASPETELRRVRLSALIIVGFDGLHRTELVTGSAPDRLEA
jgi:type III restriction enzyme